MLVDSLFVVDVVKLCLCISLLSSLFDIFYVNISVIILPDTTDRPHHIALIPTTSIKTQPNDCSQPPNNINYQQQQQRPPGNTR